jgi:hypothetical protein
LLRTRLVQLLNRRSKPGSLIVYLAFIGKSYEVRIVPLPFDLIGSLRTGWVEGILLFEFIEVTGVDFAGYLGRIWGLLGSDVIPVNSVEKRMRFDLLRATRSEPIFRVTYEVPYEILGNW